MDFDIPNQQDSLHRSFRLGDPNTTASPSSFNCTFNTSLELSTPIKRIKNLSLHSPMGQKSLIYPSLDDIIVSPSDQTMTQRPVQDVSSESPNTSMTTSMLNKGYSKKLTHNVLEELNSRANEMIKHSDKMPSKVAPKAPETRKNSDSIRSHRSKRYSGIHRSKFSTMESISSHYAATNHSYRTTTTSTSTSNSAPRHGDVHDYHHNRAVNGIKYQPISHRDNKSSPIKKDQEGPKRISSTMESHTKRRRTLNGPDDFPNFQPTTQVTESNPKPKLAAPTSTALPTSTADKFELNSSPIRKISPSKKSMNLNSILTSDDVEMDEALDSVFNSPQKPQTSIDSAVDSSRFIKPYPPSNKLRVSSLEMAGVKTNSSVPSWNHLQKKSSIPQLQKKSSIPQLQKKSSIPNLQKIPSSNSAKSVKPLPTIPTLTKKSSIPQLQRKASTPNLAPNPKTSRLVKSQSSNLTGQPISSKPSQLPTSSSAKSLSGKYTIPQQNTLYDKPTISSSQKSLNKFQRFKDRFS